MCHIFRTKTHRALIFVVNDRYRVAIAISLSLKAQNVGSKMVQNRNFRENRKNRENRKFL